MNQRERAVLVKNVSINDTVIELQVNVMWRLGDGATCK